MDGYNASEYLIRIWNNEGTAVQWAPELVVEHLHTALSFVTVVASHRALVLASASETPIAPVRELPLAQSLCAGVARSNQALTVNDARSNVGFAENEEVQRYGLVAYLGVPLVNSAGDGIGALCAWDTKPREWSQADIDSLSRYSAVVSDQLARRQIEGELRRACLRLEQLDIVVPHEIRTPLTAIMGALEMLSEGEAEWKETADVRWMLDMANRNGKRLLDFVEKMPL